MSMMQFHSRNLSMLMDLYELTMANGYFLRGNGDDRVTFDVFYRQNPDGGGFSIFAGLEQVLEYIEDLHFSEADVSYLRSLNMFAPEFLDYLRTYRFTGDIDAFPEGAVMYPHEPILTVTAPPIDAQIVETALLAQINHQSMIATKAQRIVSAARGRGVSDFGARRAHNVDAAVYGARAAYIGGVSSTATVLAGQMFGIPVSGTMAHSWIMYFKDEYTAFRNYAETYPDACVFLVDTYDVLRSGVPNAIRVAREILAPMGRRLKGVRLDSGDLAYLSKRTRALLDESGLQDCAIVASNSLDEYTISSLLDQGACINSFGVGERLITSFGSPVFGAVYKLVAVERGGVSSPRIKVSEAVEKITNPCRKRVYRVFNSAGQAVADLLTLDSESVDMTSPYPYVNPEKPWKDARFRNCTVRELQRPVIRNGRRVHPPVPVGEVREYCARQLAREIWPEEQRFKNPHKHLLAMSRSYYETKMALLSQYERARQ